MYGAIWHWQVQKKNMRLVSWPPLNYFATMNRHIGKEISVTVSTTRLVKVLTSSFVSFHSRQTKLKEVSGAGGYG